MFDLDQTNLEWQTFQGHVPSGAVSIVNKSSVFNRIDYVSKYGVHAGFYNPAMGPYCHYHSADKTMRGSPFEILVNKDNFEFLEWKDGSYGSVPPNSVKTCKDFDIYVGKNKFGLGKVDVRNKAFYLSSKGSERSDKHYQVLTFDRDIISEDISDVKYKTDGVNIIKYPPETMDKYTVSNHESKEVKGTATFSKTTLVEHRWDTSLSLTVGVTAGIIGGVPSVASGNIEISAAITLQFTKGTTHSESKTHSLAVEYQVPPNHYCSVRMVGYKYGADIPYTASLRRTYRNGKTTLTSISGTYKSVQIGEVQAVVDRCEPLPNPTPTDRIMEEAP